MSLIDAAPDRAPDARILEVLGGTVFAIDALIYQWIRFALTGDAQKDTDDDELMPPANSLVLVLESEKANLLAQYPCLSSIGLPETIIDDKKAYAEAVGLAVASRVRTSALWTALDLDDTAEVRIGSSVTFKPKSQSASEFVAALSGPSDSALKRISCIANIPKPPPQSVMGRIGTRGHRSCYGGSYRRY